MRNNKDFKKTASVLASGLLIGGALVSPRAALAKDPLVVAATEPRKLMAPPSSAVLSSVIQLPAALARRAETKCKPSHLYSSHDVVGDPQSCIINRVVIGAGGVAP
jgi:hypothetical protein